MSVQDVFVTIAGTKYQLDTTIQEPPPYISHPQSYFLADEKERFWQIWAQRSWHQGERHKRILDSRDLDVYAYHDGEGVDISEWGEVKLQPALARSLAIQSATMPMTVSNDGSTAVVVGVATDDSGVAGNQYIRRYTSSWASINTPNSGAVTDLITGIGSNMYGIQGTHIIESTDNGATWANNASSGVPTDSVGLAFCANQLYALGPSTLKYWDGSEWQSAAT